MVWCCTWPKLKYYCHRAESQGPSRMLHLSREDAKGILKRHGLRSTTPRLAVIQILASADRPLSHSDVVKLIKDTDCDPATIFRNLIKLKDAGLAPVVSRVDGIDRYSFNSGQGEETAVHQHPHFACDDCGQVTCLPPMSAPMELDEPWSKAISQATIQFRGQCPQCI